jgi:hypothetical protein
MSPTLAPPAPTFSPALPFPATPAKPAPPSATAPLPASPAFPFAAGGDDDDSPQASATRPKKPKSTRSMAPCYYQIAGINGAEPKEYSRARTVLAQKSGTVCESVASANV